MEVVAPLAKEGWETAKTLFAQCDGEGRLPKDLAEAPARLVAALENALA